MERIELNSYDKEDLLKLLDYAEEQKKKHKDDMTKWWLLRINHLKHVIHGFTNTPSYIQSSYQTIEKGMNEKDRQKWRYRKSLENDLVDFIDYIDEKKGEDSLF